MGRPFRQSQRPRPVLHCFDLDPGQQRCNPLPQRAAVELGDNPADVVGGGGRHGVAGEVPDHGAQLPRHVKGETVVDADDDVVHQVVQAVPALAVGVVDEHVVERELTETILAVLRAA